MWFRHCRKIGSVLSASFLFFFFLLEMKKYYCILLVMLNYQRFLKCSSFFFFFLLRNLATRRMSAFVCVCDMVWKGRAKRETERGGEKTHTHTDTPKQRRQKERVNPSIHPFIHFMSDLEDLNKPFGKIASNRTNKKRIIWFIYILKWKSMMYRPLCWCWRR